MTPSATATSGSTRGTSRNSYPSRNCLPLPAQLRQYPGTSLAHAQAPSDVPVATTLLNIEIFLQ
eukprot:12166-Rhodomonas_salina.1